MSHRFFDFLDVEDNDLDKCAIEHESQKFTYRQLDSCFTNIHPDFPFCTDKRLTTALAFIKCLQEGTPFFPVDAANRQSLPYIDTSKIDKSVQLLLATSGTTGQPKIVCLSSAALKWSAESFNRALNVDNNDKWLCALPLNHIAGLSIFVRSMLSKSTVVLHENFSPSATTNTIDEGVTLVSMVPTMLKKIFQESNWSAPSHLKAVLLGGAMISDEILKEATSRGIPIVRSYGMTETSSGIALDGISFPGVELKTDSDNILYIKSPSLMQGYWEAPSIGDWFKTQDVAQIENGKLKIMGRKDSMIITGGENVSLHDIESHFIGLKGVSSVQAIGIPDETWGQVIGLVVQAISKEKATQNILDVLDILPSNLKPRRLAFVESIPNTQSGKAKRFKPQEIRNWTSI